MTEENLIQISKDKAELRNAEFRSTHPNSDDIIAYVDIEFNEEEINLNQADKDLYSFEFCTFNRCSFNYGNNKSDSFKYSKFINTVFYKCDLGKANFSGATFDRCYFLGCVIPELQKEQITNCIIKDCLKEVDP